MLKEAAAPSVWALGNPALMMATCFRMDRTGDWAAVPSVCAEMGLPSALRLSVNLCFVTRMKLWFESLGSVARGAQRDPVLQLAKCTSTVNSGKKMPVPCVCVTRERSGVTNRPALH